MMTKKVHFYTKQERIDSFDKYLNQAWLWLQKGDDLMVSVKLLKEKCSFYTKSWLNKSKDDIGKPLSDEDRIFSTIQMLKAMALECYLKALWVDSGNTLSKAPGKYGKIPHTKEHDLKTLADVLTSKNIYKFSDDEINLLARMSPYIIIGRYPFAKRYDSLCNVPSPKGAKLSPGTICMSDKGDESTFQQMVTNIKSIIESNSK